MKQSILVNQQKDSKTLPSMCFWERNIRMTWMCPIFLGLWNFPRFIPCEKDGIKAQEISKLCKQHDSFSSLNQKVRFLQNFTRHALQHCTALHRGLGSRFCDRYEVTQAPIQKLTNLVSNERLKPQGSRYEITFWKFSSLIGEISIWRWKSPSFENSRFFDKKNKITKCKEKYVNNWILENGILK